MRNALFVALFIFAAAVAASAQSRSIYFPQIADGNEGGGFFWKTTIFLTNPALPGSPAVSGTIDFVAANGAPIPVSFVDESGQPAGRPIAFSLGPTQTKKFVSTSAAPVINVGLAAVTSNGDLAGTAVFSRYGPNGVVSEASVPAVTPAFRQAVIVDTTPGFDTGVA